MCRARSSSWSAVRSASTSTGRAAATPRRWLATPSSPPCRRCATRSSRAWAASAPSHRRSSPPTSTRATLPTSTEWSIGTQMMIPWSTSVDVAYVGHHNYNAELTQQINAVDIGSAFDPTKQDPTSAPSTTPGAASLAALYPDLVRGYKGYTAIALRTYDGWRKYDAIQFSINRRLQERHRVRVQRRDHPAGRRQGRAALRSRRRRQPGRSAPIRASCRTSSRISSSRAT